MKPLTPDVVSIQSQVVYGTVGNTAAAHVLQANGFEVAQVPTVILSSTPHYDTLYGGPVPREWFSGWLQASLYGVSRFDPATIAGVAVLMCLVTGLATYIPARRAASVEPTEALREG